MTTRTSPAAPLLPTLLVVLALLPACGDDATVLEPRTIEGPGDYTRTLVSGGRQRTYHVHVPPGVDPSAPSPVALVFHGVPRTEGGMARLAGFDRAADAHGLVAVYPEAAPFVGDWSVSCDVCTRANREAVDDVRFVQDLLDQLGRELALEPERTYAVGYSLGGVLTFELACRISGRISGFATVGALMLARQRRSCSPSRSLGALLIHGTADPQFPWDGFEGPQETRLPARETVSFWTETNACPDAPSVRSLPDSVDDGTTVTLESYAPCAGDARVAFYIVHGGGHPWPGAPADFSRRLGPESEELDASAVVARFLTRIRGGPVASRGSPGPLSPMAPPPAFRPPRPTTGRLRVRGHSR